MKNQSTHNTTPTELPMWVQYVQALGTPIVVALVGAIGSCVANGISKDHDKATMLKEFLPTLVSGEPGEKVIAKIALKPYLTSDDWKLIDPVVQAKVEDTFVGALKEKDEKASAEAAKSLNIMFPMYQPSYRLSIPSGASTATLEVLKQNEPTLKPLLDKFQIAPAVLPAPRK